MKLIRALFQITVSLVMLVIFSHPLSADTRDTTTDKLFSPPAPTTESQPTRPPASTVLAELESGFIEGVVPTVSVLLAGLAVGLAAWLMIPTRRVETEVDEQHPVEVPPLRAIPQRVTKF